MAEADVLSEPTERAAALFRIEQAVYCDAVRGSGRGEKGLLREGPRTTIERNLESLRRYS